MKLTKVQRFILFSLGKWFEEANKRIKGKSLEVSISKKRFIEVAMKAGFAEKKQRAFYKNLEALEKRRLVSYEQRELFLTERGEREYRKMSEDLAPYLMVIEKLKTKSPTSYTKKVQTVFR
jgi:hypothetical protein